MRKGLERCFVRLEESIALERANHAAAVSFVDDLGSTMRKLFPIPFITVYRPDPRVPPDNTSAPPTPTLTPPPPTAEVAPPTEGSTRTPHRAYLPWVFRGSVYGGFVNEGLFVVHP